MRKCLTWVALLVPLLTSALIVQPIKDSDKDPQVIEIHYNSVIDSSEYLPQRVLIEVSSRSLMEPIEERKINTILSEYFLQQSFLTVPFAIPTVLPQSIRPTNPIFQLSL